MFLAMEGVLHICTTAANIFEQSSGSSQSRVPIPIPIPIPSPENISFTVTFIRQNTTIWFVGHQRVSSQEVTQRGV
jgi:hypothetical protein